MCFCLRLWVLPPYEHGLSPNTGGAQTVKKHDFFWRFAPPLFRSCPHTVIHPFKWRNIHHNISFFFGFDYGKVTSKCRWVTLSLFHARDPWGCSNPNMLPLRTWWSANHIEVSIRSHASFRFSTLLVDATLAQFECCNWDTQVHGGLRNKTKGCRMAKSWNTVLASVWFPRSQKWRMS